MNHVGGGFLMDNVVMVAPNAGLEMAGGGGCRVAAKVAEAMNERGYGIELVALTGDTLEQIERLHGVRLGDTNLRYILGKGSTLPVPEPVALSMLSLYIRRLLSMIEPRLIVFQDDILLPAVKNYNGKILVYTHFPLLHKARARARFSEEWRVSIKQRVYDMINQRLLAYNSNPADVIIANSTITYRYCKTAWNRDDIEILFPPVDNPFLQLMKPESKKEQLVMSMGGIHPGKRHELAIMARKLSKLDYDLVVLGYQPRRSRWLENYRRFLCSISREMDRESCVKILCNASERRKWNLLTKAKIIVHASNLEPFGIVVVEGMAAGAVPVVYKGPVSGPWIDILNKGEYGLGFEDSEDLSDRIDELLTNDSLWNKYSRIARKRARHFDTLKFKHNFLGIVEQLCSCA